MFKQAGFAALLLLTSCGTVVHHGKAGNPAPTDVRIMLAPFANATDDQHAARALTELTASALLERGFPLVQDEPALKKARDEADAGGDGRFLEAARALNATHLVIGTIHEYRYKTDLDGDPAVGVTLRLVEAASGQTLWQGSSSKVSVFFASVSSAAQYAVRRLVARMPTPKASATAAEARTSAPSS